MKYSKESRGKQIVATLRDTNVTGGLVMGESIVTMKLNKVIAKADLCLQTLSDTPFQ